MKPIAAPLLAAALATQFLAPPTAAAAPPARFQLALAALGAPSPTASGGAYTLDSLITPASHAGSPMTGGTFLVAGGFWEAVASTSEVPGPPSLAIRVLPGSVEITWPSTAHDEVLEESPSAQGPWTPAATTPQSDGTSRRATLPATGEQRFFRLRRP